MDRIVNTDEQIVLIYNIKGERFSTVERLAQIRGYRLINISDNQVLCRVEDIIFGNTKDCEIIETEVINMEFLLFVNILNDDLYGYIGELKQEGLYFPNKAILTKMNSNWQFRRLLVENKEEHAVMTMFTNLRRAMKKATAIVEENKHDDELIEIMDHAKHFLNPREFDFDEMKEIHNKLANKVNSLK